VGNIPLTLFTANVHCKISNTAPVYMYVQLALMHSIGHSSTHNQNIQLKMNKHRMLKMCNITLQ